ncbi:hydrolase [Gordoniibacillus kamchatkensis]|uniref:Hydrolase n=1 Tax=Gordoniibacillus kamchatkensis TaxID=1590651 RepID=A0ABR5APS7_9BACL|nr:HAD-IA family hydrolase [Paenibacillus sp. VKM B-2647]KIL42535.1 hydrolase [Paenibacillus sp. VKM B-2647]
MLHDLLKKPLHDYKMICFDVGDTLMTIPAARIILHDYLLARSLRRDPEQLERQFTSSFRLFYYDRPAERVDKVTPESDRAFWVRVYDHILRSLELHRELSADDVHRCCHELYDIFTAADSYELFADVQPCLQELQARGFRLGVVSNFAPTLRGILQAKGILHYFDPVIVSTEVGLEKPDPAIFRLALERSGLRADDILYIGDHDRNDIWAPAQAGIDALKIIRYDFHSGEGIRSLGELIGQG